MKNLKFELLATVIALLCSTIAFAQPDPELTKACKAGDLKAVKKIVEGGADVNALRSDGNSVLLEAMFWPEITQYLIDKGADPNLGSTTALQNAAGHYSYETMEVLLKNGADVNKGTTQKQLHPIAQMIVFEKAKKKPNKKLIKTWEKQLSGAGANMEPVVSTTSPLENTINQTNCVPCLAVLLKYKGNPSEKDAVGNDLITNSIVRHMSVAKNFETYGKKLQNEWGYKLPSWYYNRVKEGNSLGEIKALVDAGADLNYTNPVSGNTPLMAALGSKNTEAAKYMIEKGADINFLTPNKKDALSIAVESGDLELVKMIVEKGANVNTETWGLDSKSGQYAKGFTPLTIAVVNNHKDIAKYLIDQGSKPKEGVSGYHVNPKSGCPYNLKNKTAIYYAIENNNMEMVKMLVEGYDKWNMHLMEMKQPEKSSETDYGPITVEVTTCYKIKGKFTPSVYAKKLGQKEMSTFLKSKGI